MTDHPLTPRQLEVCVLAMQGLRGPEIALRLGISQRAADARLSVARSRMGARTVRQLMAMLGRELGGVEVR